MKLRFTVALLLLTVAGLLLVQGCSTGETKGDTFSQLHVTSTFPVDGSTASRDTEVVVTFNHRLNESTVKDDNFYLTDSAGNRVPGVLSYNALNSRITFISDNYYEIGERYTVYVKGAIESYENEKLRTDYIFNFDVTY